MIQSTPKKLRATFFHQYNSIEPVSFPLYVCSCVLWGWGDGLRVDTAQVLRGETAEDKRQRLRNQRRAKKKAAGNGPDVSGTRDGDKDKGHGGHGTPRNHYDNLLHF